MSLESTQRTHELFQKLLENLHKDHKTLVDLMQAYSANVSHLIDLAAKLEGSLQQALNKEEPPG